MALSLWTAEKLLGARAGIVAAAPGANRLNALPIENQHVWFWKMIVLLELIYVDTQMDSNGLFFMSTDLLWYYLSGGHICTGNTLHHRSVSPAIFHFPGLCVKKLEGHGPRSAMFHPRIALVTLQTPIRSRQCFVGRGLKKDGDGWTTKLRKVDQHTCILAYIESYTLPCLALHYLTLLYITLPYITFPYPTLHYLALHYLTLHYITLPDIKYYIYYITLALHHIKK